MASVKKVTTIEQLQEIFRRAQAGQIPVSVYRKPISSGVALDFSEWRKIETFDIDNLMVVVPPGMLLKDLNDMAVTRKLRFIPADTPVLENLSVGEWAYRGCPNPSAWKYGAGKHFLLGATYVFPNGDVAPVGGKCIKNVTGYDFTRFFTGAYADLAVGVRYIIKLMPQPEYRYRYDASFNSLTDIIQFVGMLQECSVPPAWLFWFDKIAASALFNERHQEHRVLFELDSNKTEVLEQVARIDGILSSCNGKKNPTATDLPDLSYIEDRTDGFWLTDEFRILYPTVLTFAEHFKQQLSKHNLVGGLFGQLADGKLHIYMASQISVNKDIVQQLQNQAKVLGGASSGKYDRLYGSLSNDKLAILETSVKRLVDPHLIFNRREEDIK